MADVITANTQLGATKQDLIASLVQKELAFKAVLTGAVTDVSVYAAPGSKSISFPKLTSFTATARTEGTLGEAVALTASVDQLLLNDNAYVSWIIDSITSIQANIPAQIVSAQRAAAAMSRYVDNALIVAIRAAAASFINVGADADVTYANLLNLVLKIEEADGDLGQSVFLVSPKQKSVLLGLNEFKSSEYYGAPNALKGQIGMILGVPVVAHNGLAQKEVFLMEKSSMAIGFQKSAAYGEQDEIQYGVGSKRAAVEQLFGVKAMQTGLKGAAAGKSPLIVGLND